MKVLNMIWANEAGVSVYIYEGEHERRVIEIHGVVNDYETVLATATIEKHNRDRLADTVAIRPQGDFRAGVAACVGRVKAHRDEWISKQQRDSIENRSAWDNWITTANRIITELESLTNSATPAQEEKTVCECHWSSVQEMHDDFVALETQMHEWKTNAEPLHRCEPIARAVMDEHRDWWIGKLIEPVPEWPKETHCLHMKTPIKSVVFLCNGGDFEQLLVMSNAVVQLKNLDWLDAATEGAMACAPESAAAPQEGEEKTS